MSTAARDDEDGGRARGDGGTVRETARRRDLEAATGLGKKIGRRDVSPPDSVYELSGRRLEQ